VICDNYPPSYFGWCDFDIVWGRIERFYPDELIREYDVVSDCAYDYISGPFTLLRNTKRMREMFMECPEWRAYLESPTTNGWGEHAFTQVVKASGVKMHIANHHAYDSPELLHQDADGTLWHGEREVAYFHFRRTKQWPLK
jgi:hypothetical protein